MGLGGGLVRRVFAKSRSAPGVHETNEKNFGVEKSRWSSIRVYLCGDEFNSVLAEEDPASIKSSEATVSQSVLISSVKREEESFSINKPEAEQESSTEKEESSRPNASNQEDAAILIQSAFRGFLARRQYKENKNSDKEDHVEGVEEPSEESEEAISTEVQIGGSVDSLSIRDENFVIQDRVLRKSQTQIYRLKEEWDDSTVSSNISKLRIQNRLEAMTRRERALAYAFSQQLRTCSMKKKSNRSDSNESNNMGWTWLERWMATRLPESFADDCLSKHHEPISSDRKTTILKKRLDFAFEEKESCGSNDVSVNLDSLKTPSQPTVDRPKSSVPHRKSLLMNKVVTKTGKDRRCKQVQPKSSGEIKAKDGSESVADH